MSDKIFNELYDAYERKGAAVKKKKMYIKWQSQIRLLHILGGKNNG